MQKNDFNSIIQSLNQAVAIASNERAAARVVTREIGMIPELARKVELETYITFR